MSRFQTTRASGHTPAQMFELVADIERYPEFLPLCEAVAVRSRATTEAGEVLTADMSVGYRAIRETFHSLVTIDRDRMCIEVTSTEAPFSNLVSVWHFAADDQGGSVIAFDIDYRFRSRALQLLMGTMFDKAFSHFARAFEARADAIYNMSVTQP
jgi:coenzyme Q-binding protein COQ10